MRLVSVIIPTFNRAAVLPRAMDSVVKQIYSNWELIIVDDGSTDETLKVINGWLEKNPVPQKIQILSSEKNRGVSFARNFGVSRASGSWLAFLDSDDEWLPARLSSQIALLDSAIESEQPLRWVHGGEAWVRNGKAVAVPARYAKFAGRIFSKCVDTCTVGASTVLLEKRLFLDNGGFREDFPVCEDYDLWLKLAARWPVGLVSEPVVVKFGGHADQLSMKYIGMDYYRCLALESQLSNPYLTASELAHVSRALIEKRIIVSRGAAKHSAHTSELRLR